MKVPKPVKLPSGNWFIRMRLNGISVPVTARTKTECIRTAEAIKAQHNANKKQISASSRDMTLRQCIDKYVSAKKNLSPSTVRGYHIIQRNRFQAVMDKPVASIRNWQKHYDADAERLSPKTMKNTWGLISSACKFCGYDLPNLQEEKVRKKEHEFLTPDEVLRFTKEVHGEKCEIPALLALCSLRLSEIMALTWGDIDLEHERIRVSGAMVIGDENKLVVKDENKTEQSTRYVPILIPSLYDALNAAQNDPSSRVVSCKPNTVYRQITAFLSAHGFPPVGVHGLRHSFASLAHHLQIPVLETCIIGGWSDYNTVMKIYTHLDRKDTSRYGQHIKRFYENANAIANDPEKIIDFTALLVK